MDKARREELRREATTCAWLEPFGPWGTRLELLDALDEMEAERDAARRHIDEAGDGLNLLAVLDLYHERAVSAETSLDELEVQLENVSDERDRLIVWRDELAEKLRTLQIQFDELEETVRSRRELMAEKLRAAEVAVEELTFNCQTVSERHTIAFRNYREAIARGVELWELAAAWMLLGDRDADDADSGLAV